MTDRVRPQGSGTAAVDLLRRLLGHSRPCDCGSCVGQFQDVQAEVRAFLAAPEPRTEDWIQRAAELERRLELLEDGACSSGYGNGCDGQCKYVAFGALEEWRAIRAFLARHSPPPAPPEEGLTFRMLRRISAQRCAESFKVCADWTAADWGNALAGEGGEACNLIKKLRRGEPIPPEKIADELADVAIYADLAAWFLGQSLEAAVVRKFNEVSERVGSPLRLPAPPKEREACPKCQRMGLTISDCDHCQHGVYIGGRCAECAALGGADERE